MGFKDKDRNRIYQDLRIINARLEWVKQNGPCKKCGSSLQLEVDHINPKTKKSHKIWGWNKARREKELKKCQVLCRPCHQEKTNQENGYNTSHDNSGYRRGCRCGLCKQDHRIVMQKYRKKIRMSQ